MSTWKSLVDGVANISAPIFVLIVNWVAFLWLWLLGSTWGILLLTTIAYICSPTLLGVRPFGIGEVILWFSDLSEGAQVAAAATLVTAIGLMAAYWTAIGTWTKQREIESKLLTASEIVSSYQAASAVASELGAYLSVLIETTTRVTAATDGTEQRYQLLYVNSQAARFDQLKRQLHERRLHMNSLITIHATTLMSTFFVFDKFRAAIEVVDSAWEACQFLPPRGDEERHSFVGDFMRRYDEQKARAAETACERVAADAAALIGTVNGLLSRDVARPTLAAAFYISKDPVFFSKVARMVWRQKPNKSISATMSGD